VLTDYLGGKSSAGKKMKSASGWFENGNGTNSSGFSGLPGGYRFSDGTFFTIGNYGYWWSSTEGDTGSVWYRGLYYDEGYVDRYDCYKTNGFSVRCLRD
jgi:uncharacterized protein (TIGR02145 family)